MPLVEVNPEFHTVRAEHSHKKLRRSCWRKIAGIAAFIQVTLYLLITLLAFSGVVIQIHTGTAPYHNELYQSMENGVLVTALHRDILEAKNFAIFGEEKHVEETLGTGKIQDGVSISTELKTELEEADWGMLFSILIFVAVISMNQCWRGAQLLRSTLKWRNPDRAMQLLESWSQSMSSFRNYLVGFTIATCLFATHVSFYLVIGLASFWVLLCLLSGSVYGYHKQLFIAIHKKDDDEDDLI